MAGYEVLGIEATVEFDAPVEQVVGLVDAMLQPVQAFGIAAEIVRWLDILPLREAGAMPGLADRVQ